MKKYLTPKGERLYLHCPCGARSRRAMVQHDDGGFPESDDLKFLEEHSAHVSSDGYSALRTFRAVAENVNAANVLMK